MKYEEAIELLKQRKPIYIGGVEWFPQSAIIQGINRCTTVKLVRGKTHRHDFCDYEFSQRRQDIMIVNIRTLLTMMGCNEEKE